MFNVLGGAGPRSTTAKGKEGVFDQVEGVQAFSEYLGAGREPQLR